MAGRPLWDLEIFDFHHRKSKISKVFTRQNFPSMHQLYSILLHLLKNFTSIIPPFHQVSSTQHAFQLLDSSVKQYIGRCLATSEQKRRQPSPLSLIDVFSCHLCLYMNFTSPSSYTMQIHLLLNSSNRHNTGLLQLKVDVAPLAYEAIMPTIDEYMPRMAVVNDPKKKNKRKLFKSKFCLYPLIHLFTPSSR